MSLLDLLSGMPSTADKFQQIIGLSGGDGAGSIRPTQTAPAGGDSRWENVARRMAANKYGYTPEQLNMMDEIITQESQWDPNAVNPSSGAAGLAQNISGFGPGYSQDNPKEQIRWLLNYLGSHNYEGYGTGIEAAYAHKRDTGWY